MTYSLQYIRTVYRSINSNVSKISISRPLLMAVCALAIILFYNTTFMSHALERFNPFTLDSLSFILALCCLLFVVLMCFFSLFIPRFIFKSALIMVFFTVSMISYFNGIGVVFDENMIVNMLETNLHETTELINISFLIHMFIFGFLPSFAIYTVTVIYASVWRDGGKVFLSIFSVAVVCAVLIFMSFQYMTFFSRENRDLRLYINPLFPMTSVKHVISDRYKTNIPFHIVGLDAKQLPTHEKPTLGIFIVGETARADHFSINGYSKETSPKLAKRNLLNFKYARSCGTSTAYSVPCMFSFLNEKQYSPEKASTQSNLLDVLEIAGVKTLWRDNNSSCKGVCSRVENENFTKSYDTESPYFHLGAYIDDSLLDGLDGYIQKNNQGDLFIVMHQLGSHGPAYHKRYPDKFAKFTPFCESNSPHNCTEEEVSNSYDNTILYTDYFIDKVITYLESKNESYNTFMMYVSDHGESLGESGVYLHGLPKSIAPEAQTHVPFMLWTSENLKPEITAENKVAISCGREQVSHDNIVHSLLALYSVKTTLRDDSKNVFHSPCTSNSSLANN